MLSAADVMRIRHVEILDGVEHANFFEQRATEYSKGASRGTWDGENGVWADFDRRQAAAAM
ncbi:MAG: hypothetical protein WA268_16565 [Xanthobacteraceae bacterium]